MYTAARIQKQQQYEYLYFREEFVQIYENTECFKKTKNVTINAIAAIDQNAVDKKL